MTDEQILEEHEFCFELAGQELPVVAPLKDPSGASLSEKTVDAIRFRFALYPRKGGHAPELDRLENLYILGRLLGRMHRIGAVKEGVLRNHMILPDGRFRHSVFYSILDTEWPGVKHRLE